MKKVFTAKVLVLTLAAVGFYASVAQADIASATALQAQNGVLAGYRRLLPLDGGSNFRDLGGYPTLSGKTVRRGLLFRSAAPSSLTAQDEHYLAQFGFESVMDLRSSEEIALFPNRWAEHAGLHYYKHDYAISSLIPAQSGENPQPINLAESYPGIALSLQPQLRQYFTLLAEGKAPIMLNCSAGQDRTGITSALLLSVLGVPPQLVVEDYLLSSDFRRPSVERGNVDLAAAAKTNAFAAMMTSYSQTEVTHAAPLVTADGTPYLEFALRQIEQEYGSVEGFLTKKVGITPEQLARIRALYLQ
ncbi:MAG: tyrosine-protein phosphatase [Pseudomonadales bacterium]|jgi:protein-tyrosine phosphatase|nr:tyrosine-protein phosphatase [Pseudomonadales bacterium]